MAEENIESAQPDAEGQAVSELHVSEGLKRGFYLTYLETVNQKNMQQCIKFLRDARRAAQYENKHNLLNGRASYWFGEVMSVAVNQCLGLVDDGDYHTIKAVPAWKEALEQAYRRYGNSFRQIPNEAQWINRFAFVFQKGWLWNNGQMLPIKWPSGTQLPDQADWRAWTKLAKAYLQQKYGDEPWRLTIFLGLLATRKCMGKRLGKAPREAMSLLELLENDAYKAIKRIERNKQEWINPTNLRLWHSQPSYQWRAIMEELEGAFKLIAKKGPAARGS